MKNKTAPETLLHEPLLHETLQETHTSALSLPSRWLLNIIAVAMTYFLCTLGFWQLDRAHQKEQLLSRHAARSNMTPLDLQSLLQRQTDVADFPLTMRGTYLNEYSFLLDNRIHEGQSGYNVITPFVSEKNVVLVDRGWLPQLHSRRDLPSIPVESSEQIVVGNVYEPTTKAFLLKNDDYSRPQWPMLIQKIDIEKMVGLLSGQVAPFILRLAADNASPFVRDPVIHTLSPDKNYAYAFQWFAMAIAVVALTLTLNLRRYFKVKP